MDKYTVNRKEILKSLTNGGRDFLYYAAPPERWAIEYGGQAFGWGVCVMSNATKSPKFDPEYASSSAATRDYLAMCLAHDNTLWPVFCKPSEAYKVIRIKQIFGIGEDDVVFYPYWGETHPAKTSGKEIYTVTYTRGKTAMVIVCNLSLQNQDIVLTLDKKILGNAPQVIDAENKQPVTFSGNKFNLSVKRRDFRIFFINK